MARKRPTLMENPNTAFFARMMQLLGIPALLFLGSTMYFNVDTVSRQVNELKTTVAVLSTVVENSSRERVTKSDLALQDSTIKDLTRRVEVLERVPAMRGTEP